MTSIANSILNLHGFAALALVFGLPFLESAAFVGFIFPGETAALLAGVLAFQHRLSLPEAIVAVVLGAILGDTVGYEVGRHFGTRLIHGPFSRWIKADHLRRTEQLLERRGGWAVFLGRFTTALRVLIPGIAGVGRMPYRRFAFFNMTGGAVWGVGFVLLGYAAGASWHRVASTASTVGLIAVGVVAVVAVVYLVVRRRRRGPREATAAKETIADADAREAREKAAHAAVDPPVAGGATHPDAGPPAAKVVSSDESR